MSDIQRSAVLACCLLHGWAHAASLMAIRKFSSDPLAADSYLTAAANLYNAVRPCILQWSARSCICLETQLCATQMQPA